MTNMHYTTSSPMTDVPAARPEAARIDAAMADLDGQVVRLREMIGALDERLTPVLIPVDLNAERGPDPEPREIAEPKSPIHEMVSALEESVRRSVGHLNFLLSRLEI